MEGGKTSWDFQMIDDPVVALSSECVSFFDHILADYPVYRLDATLPSIGVLDLLTFDLRRKRGLSQLDQRFITWSASYVAGIVHDCFSMLPSRPRVAVRLIEGADPDIVLEVKEKAKSRQFYLQASVAARLLELLQQMPSPLPIMAGYARSITPFENVLSPFAYGLLSGRPEGAEGTWAGQSTKESADRLAAVANYVAHSCASFYKRRFPGETIGSNPALYLDAAVFPPPGFNEPFPYCRLAAGAAAHLKRNPNLSKKDIESIALNWLQACDDLLSPLGFIIAAAAAQPPYDPRLRYAAQSVGMNAPLLRPGVLLAREALGADVDWVEMLSLGSIEACRRLFEKDSVLGLHPFLRLSFERCQEPELRNLVNALAWSKAESARGFIEQLPFHKSSDLEVWMQSVVLDLALGRIEDAARELSRIASQKFETHSLAHFDYLELRGTLALAQGKIEEAAAAFTTAFDIQLDNPERLVAVGANLSGCLLHLGRVEDAKVVVDTAASSRATSISALVTKVDVYRAAGLEAQARDVTRVLARTAPKDRRVFQRVLESVRTSAEATKASLPAGSKQPPEPE